jgi:hypothetical protein
MGWRRTPRKLESWQKAIIIAVHKKGNIKVCENYSGINLVNSGDKLYANVFNNKFYKNKVGKEQNGF